MYCPPPSPARAPLFVPGDLPQQHWSDVFKESGPGDLGSGGSEPAVDILMYGPADAPSSSSSNTSSTTAAAAGPGAGKFTLKCTASCGPHKLLAAESFTASDVDFTARAAAATCPDSGPGSGSDSALLLGLTDDVDCAVMTATFSSSSTASAQAAAPADTAAGAAAAGGIVGLGRTGGLVLTHAAFLPAIAYVVAGKTQKRHLLLGELHRSVRGWGGGCL
jgi:hypothetical protein